MFVIYFIFNLVEIRVDSIKLLTFNRRSNCRSESDIGTWKAMIKLTSFFGTITNVGLLIFTMNTLRDINPFLSKYE